MSALIVIVIIVVIIILIVLAPLELCYGKAAGDARGNESAEVQHAFVEQPLGHKLDQVL